MILLQKYFQSHEAHMAKNFLESEGIEATLRNDLSTQIYNFTSQSNPRIELYVNAHDEEKAKTLLNASFEESIGNKYEKTETKTETNKKSKLNGVLLFLFLLVGLGILLFVLKK